MLLFLELLPLLLPLLTATGASTPQGVVKAGGGAAAAAAAAAAKSAAIPAATASASMLSSPHLKGFNILSFSWPWLSRLHHLLEDHLSNSLLVARLTTHPPAEHIGQAATYPTKASPRYCMNASCAGPWAVQIVALQKSMLALKQLHEDVDHRGCLTSEQRPPHSRLPPEVPPWYSGLAWLLSQKDSSIFFDSAQVVSMH